MTRSFTATVLTTLGAVLILGGQSWANGRGSHHSASGHQSSMKSYSKPGHSFKASKGFDYGKYGFRQQSWTHYRWSNYYRCFCYWAPRYGWCFYEPTYCCYLPISYYCEVYPQCAPVTTAVSTAPPVIQQTTVVATTAAPVPDLPTPQGQPTLAAPTAVQKTQVGPGQ
jgi:hypothetical protein